MGVATSTASTLEKVAAAFQFGVDKFRLSGPDNMKTPFYGLFRNDTAEALGSGSVSEKYVPHTTEDVLALVEAAESVFEDCEPSCYFNNGHYVDLAPTRDYRVAIYGTADNIFPRLRIRAGYDGQSFSVTMGYFRDICRNMARIRAVSATNVTIRHTNGLRGKINDLIAQFSGLRSSWDQLGVMIQRIENREVSLVSFLDSVYGQPDEKSQNSITRHKNRTAAIFRRILRERDLSGRPQIGTDWMVSGWEAFNGVQGYVQHDASRKGSPSLWDRVIMAEKDKVVAKAESLAVALAA